MARKFFFIIGIIILCVSPAYAGASFNVAVQVIAPVNITRSLPTPVNINQPFEVGLNFSNLVDLELSNISIREAIPIGYKIINKGRISPAPSYIGTEKGATVIYWNKSRLANNTTLSIKYYLSAPKSPGNYTFGANVSCLDASGDRFAAYTFENQEVKNIKSSLWQRFLDFFQSLMI